MKTPCPDRKTLFKEVRNELNYPRAGEGGSVALPWLNKKFIDPEAEFLFVLKELVLNEQAGNQIGVGVVGLVHFFIDGLFPQSLGRPIFC